MSDLAGVTFSRKAATFNALREPLFAQILRRRVFSGILALIGVAQVVTAARHVAVMVCPIPQLFGIPCPGCGLTRGTVYLTAGYWREAMTQHAFSPVVVVGLAMLLLSAVLPGYLRNRFCDQVERFERRTGIVPLLLLLLLAYWVIRLIVAPQAALMDLRI